MEYMESKMQDQIEGGMNERDECYFRIDQLEKLIKAALEISDLWRPSPDLKYSPEHEGEMKALESMYHNFKESVK